MAPAYLIVTLKDGDILMMHDMYRNSQDAMNKLFELIGSNSDSDSSWWKVIQCDIDANFDPGFYDAVVFIDWENTNRIRFMGLYREGQVPIGLYNDHVYSSERVYLTL